MTTDLVPFDPGELVLSGRDVLLDPLRADDAAALAAAAKTREHYCFNPVADGVEQAVAYFRRALRQRAERFRYPFAVRFRGRIVGTTSFSDFQPWEWPAASATPRRDR